MKTLIMLLMFISAFLIISGIHEQRLETAKNNKTVVYRYIPRSALDEQYYGTQASAHFQGMFTESKSPWLEARTPEEAGRQSFDYDRRIYENSVDVADRRGLGGDPQSDSETIESDIESEEEDPSDAESNQ